MKYVTYIILVCLILLAGCHEPLNFSQNDTLAAGTGRLNISVTETGERTILPQTPVFSKYDFIFEPLDGQKVHDNITVYLEENSSVMVDLEEGNWKVIAIAYVNIKGIPDIPDGDIKTAEGKADIKINSGAKHSVDIDLKMQPDGKGILEWEIDLRDGIQSANMTVLTLTGVEVKTVDLVDTPDGITVLDTGYYLLAIKINNQQPRTEVLHIYSGLTSRVNRIFSNSVPVFSSISDLEYYLSIVPDNTVDTPYTIILNGLNIEIDFYQNSDSLYKLFNALNGKYVSLDLSDCAGQSIPNCSNTNSRPDKDRIVSIVLPAGLTSIGSYAFYGCTGLALTELPSGITSIGSAAFYGCTSLALTELPAGLTSIGSYAFSGCTSLTSITIPAGVTNLPDGGGYFFINGVLAYHGVFSGCTNLATVTFAAGSQLESIGSYAFAYCTSLALTELPAGITSIGERAFSGCTGLALTELPAGITSIGYQTFYGCTGLALTELPSGLTSIGSAAFYGCTSLALVICHAVTPPTLGENAFRYSNNQILSNLQIKVPAGSVNAYKNASRWSEYADMIIAIDEYQIDLTFSGPTEKVIPITRTVTNNLSKSGGGSIALRVSEDFDKYEWFIGETKVTTGKEVTLYANNTAFTSGSNWITVVVYEGNVPYSGVFAIRVNN